MRLVLADAVRVSLAPPESGGDADETARAVTDGAVISKGAGFLKRLDQFRDGDCAFFCSRVSTFVACGSAPLASAARASA